jgi:purine-nucleoside phosphorylase
MAYLQADYDGAVAAIRERIAQVPAVGLVLGSGLGVLADELDDRIAIPYGDIPGWPQSTVQGHSGQLVFGQLAGHAVVVQQGRAHFYEGYGMEKVTFPVRVMHRLGVQTLMLTNAAGGVNPAYRVGDLMLLCDHINMVGMSGNNPLVGPNDERFGPRFLGMAQTYDREMRGWARDAAATHDIPLHEGVYVCLAGPNFETPAEIRMWRTLGGDAVGMSTAHEVLVARHAGMRVLACSGITNVAIDQVDSDSDANHEEVLEAGRVIVPRMKQMLLGVLERL